MRDELKASLEKIASNDPATTVLYLPCSGMGVNGAKMLAEALKKNSYLKVLMLNGYSPGVEGVAVFADALNMNSSLSSLQIEGELDNEGGIKILEALKTNRTLLRLKIKYYDSGVSFTSAQAIASAIKSNSTLLKLVVDGDMDDQGFIAIADAIKNNTTLSVLEITNHKIGLASAKAIADVLKMNVQLKALKFENCKFGDEEAKIIGEALKFNTHLKSLKLNFVEIGDTGTKMLAEMLKTNTYLSKFCFEYNTRIGLSGYKAIADMLKVNSTLRKLFFDYGDLNVTDMYCEGSKAIAEAIGVNRGLISFQFPLAFDGNDFASLVALENAVEHNYALTECAENDNYFRKKPATEKIGQYVARNRNFILINMALLIKARMDVTEDSIIRLLPKDILAEILYRVHPKITPVLFSRLNHNLFFKPVIKTESNDHRVEITNAPKKS